MSVKSVYISEIPAKLNLSLEITGRAGNLHTLKMLVCPYHGYRDIVQFYPDGTRKDINVEISGAFDGFDKDRFLSFYLPKVNAISQKFEVGGRLVVSKGVPLSAGLGGSSASVVGALKAIMSYAEDLGKSTAIDNAFLLKLGSDVPCMLYGNACIVAGAGDLINPVDLPFDASDFKVEIAKGGSDTAACYALYDKLKAENTDIDTSVCCQCNVDGFNTDYPCLNIGGEEIFLFKNDLTMPASILNKNVQSLIISLKKLHKCVFLSGSGSSVVFKPDKN